MNLKEFKDKLSTNGLARNNTWTLAFTTPKNISAIANSLFQTTANSSYSNQRKNTEFSTDLNSVISDNGYPNNANSKSLNYPNTKNVLVNTNSTVRDLLIYANACSIPSRDMEFMDFREYGEKRTTAYNNIHKDLTTSFYCSEDLRERAFFELWQDSIYNPRNLQISYYKDYVSTMEVNKYSTGWNNLMATYRFFECYPVSIGGMPLNFESTQVLRLDVTFKYRYYERVL